MSLLPVRGGVGEAGTERHVALVAPAAVRLGRASDGTRPSGQRKPRREHAVIATPEKLFKFVDLHLWIAVLPFVMHATAKTKFTNTDSKHHVRPVTQSLYFPPFLKQKQCKYWAFEAALPFPNVENSGRFG